MLERTVGIQHRPEMFLARSHAQFRRGFAAILSAPSPARDPNLGTFQVFDRNAKRMQKDRAAIQDDGARSTTVDYLRDEVADRLMERFTARPASFYSNHI